MSTIQNSLPTLASALLDLSSQTQSASGQTGANTPAPSIGQDTLTLSSSSTPDLDEATAQIEEQNRISLLADPAAALAATQTATAFISSQPDSALAAQGSPSAANVLSLIADL